MSFILEDADERYLGDMGSATALAWLRKKAGPKLSKMLTDGSVQTKSEAKAIMEEIRKNPIGSFGKDIVTALSKAKTYPVVITG